MILLDTSQKLNPVITVMQQNGVDFAWIGAHDKDGLDEYRFAGSGVVVPISMWNGDQPKHADGDCVWLNSGSGSLFVDNCNNQMVFVCEVFMNP